MVSTQKISMAVLILDKTDLKTRNITKNKERHFMKIRVYSKGRHANTHVSYLCVYMHVFPFSLLIPSPFHPASEPSSALQSVEIYSLHFSDALASRVLAVTKD